MNELERRVEALEEACDRHIEEHNERSQKYQVRMVAMDFAVRSQPSPETGEELVARAKAIAEFLGEE